MCLAVSVYRCMGYCIYDIIPSCLFDISYAVSLPHTFRLPRAQESRHPYDSTQHTAHSIDLQKTLLSVPPDPFYIDIIEGKREKKKVEQPRHSGLRLLVFFGSLTSISECT